MNDKLDIWAIIPARGGSKGIHKKNLRKVGGMPLVARCILTARNAQSVTRVLVSTDDEEITQCAHHYGADVIHRPDRISSDIASSESVLMHALDTEKKIGNNLPTIFVMLQCTAPFTTSSDIDICTAPLIEGNADSSFAATRFEHFLWQTDATGISQPVNHDGSLRKRRQDIAPQLLEAGSVYAMRTDVFIKEKNRFCGTTVAREVDAQHCFEIDTPEELNIAQQIAPLHNFKIVRSALPNPIEAVVFDFDGVFTDNSVWVNEQGQELVRCNRSDGLGLEVLRKLGIPMVVLSSEHNTIVKARCEKLKIPCVHGIEDKCIVLEQWLKENKLSSKQTIFMGNDVNDLSCLKLVGCAVGPSDSHSQLFQVLDIVLPQRGGHGVVRALCDLICEHYR